MISPSLANMTLDGPEEAVRSAVPRRKRVNFIRYADDFIVTGKGEWGCKAPDLLDGLQNMGLWKKTQKPAIILIGGPVPVLWMNEDGSEEREISDMDIIKSFHGEERKLLTNGVPEVVHLTEFLFDGPSNELLAEVGISGGLMRFEFSETLISYGSLQNIMPLKNSMTKKCKYLT